MRYHGVHPAHGIGAFVPGFFYAPENPVTAGERGYAHYIPPAAERIENSHGRKTSALAKSLERGGAFSGSAYALAGLSGCSCSGGGKIDLTEEEETWGLPGEGLPTWAHIAIGASLAAVVIGLVGVRRR